MQRDEARYWLLETIRQYAQGKLSAAGERPLLRDRHLQCYLKLAEETEPKLRGAYQQLWLNWLEDEYDNIRATLTWSLDSGQVEAGLRIAIAIYEFWLIRNYAEEASAWLERLLAGADERISPVVCASAMAYTAFLAGFQGDRSAQEAYGREATALAKAAGDAGRRGLCPGAAWPVTGWRLAPGLGPGCPGLRRTGHR